MKLNLVNSIKKSQPTFGILILFFKNYYHYFKCVGVLPACMYVLYVHHIACCSQRPREGGRPLAAEVTCSCGMKPGPWEASSTSKP